MVKPCEMPRPWALTGTIVHTETLREMTTQKYNVKKLTVFYELYILSIAACWNNDRAWWNESPGVRLEGRR